MICKKGRTKWVRGMGFLVQCRINYLQNQGLIGLLSQRYMWEYVQGYFNLGQRFKQNS